MTTETVRPARLVGAVRALLHRFRHELSGARQATRTQLVQFLARELEISEETAARLFDELRKLGVIVRDDEPLDATAATAEGAPQRWSINVEHAPGEVANLEQRLPEAGPADHVPQAVDLLRRAIACRATDIHIDPFGDEIEVRFRIDGRLEHYCRLSEHLGEQLMAQLKVMANLDPSEPFRPHEGRLLLPVSLMDYDVRITTTPVVAGGAVALRLLSREQIMRPLESLGLSSEALETIRELQGLGEGLVLVSGPSGAGKTTTLYSLIHRLDDGHRNIMTIEDPVEYLTPAFLQLQIDPKHDISYAAGLKTVLRMDPDIVLLGEVRDRETAAATMRAASSGKFIFTTLHSRDAASVVTGLRDLNIDDCSLSSNLRFIVTQRLVRRLCTCRDWRIMQDDEAALFAAHGMTPPDRVPQPIGCAECRETGYFDRIGVFEVAAVTPEIAAAIERGQNESELRRLLRSSGVPSLLADGLKKVSAAVTTLEEVRSLTGLNAA